MKLSEGGAVTVPPAQVVATAGVAVLNTSAGKVSVRLTSVTGTGFGLVTVTVRRLAWLTVRVALPKALAMVKGRRTLSVPLTGSVLVTPPVAVTLPAGIVLA